MNLEKLPTGPDFTTVFENINYYSASEQVRFTDNELNEFKELILEKLEGAKVEYGLLRAALTRPAGSSPTFILAEDSDEIFSREEIAQLSLRLGLFIEQLQNALIRIQNKTYGICRVTGKLIAKELLMSIPHTTMGIATTLASTELSFSLK